MGKFSLEILLQGASSLPITIITILLLPGSYKYDPNDRI